MTRRLSLALFVFFSGAVSAAAQPSSWGVSAGVVPSWETPSSAKFLFASADRVDFRGSEFRIGFARGRMLSGDWGVSFVRKTFSSSDSRLDGVSGESCLGRTEFINGVKRTEDRCTRFLFTVQPSNLTLTGVEIHKFVPFGTIRQRVQIGLNFGGGIARATGMLTRHDFVAESVRISFGPVSAASATPPPDQETVREVGVRPVRFGEILFSDVDVIPLGKLELAVAVIAARGLKVRLSGGLNFPGTQRLSVTALYLFNQ